MWLENLHRAAEISATLRGLGKTPSWRWCTAAWWGRSRRWFQTSSRALIKAILNKAASGTRNLLLMTIAPRSCHISSALFFLSWLSEAPSKAWDTSMWLLPRTDAFQRAAHSDSLCRFPTWAKRQFSLWWCFQFFPSCLIKKDTCLIEYISGGPAFIIPSFLFQLPLVSNLVVWLKRRKLFQQKSHFVNTRCFPVPTHLTVIPTGGNHFALFLHWVRSLPLSTRRPNTEPASGALRLSGHPVPPSSLLLLPFCPIFFSPNFNTYVGKVTLRTLKRLYQFLQATRWLFRLLSVMGFFITKNQIPWQFESLNI